MRTCAEELEAPMAQRSVAPGLASKFALALMQLMCHRSV